MTEQAKRPQDTAIDHPASRPVGPEATIRQRLAERANPKPYIGRCTACCNEQPVSSEFGPMASGMASDMWRCARCGAQVAVTVTIGGENDSPSPDEDIRSLLSLVDALRQERDGLVEVITGNGYARVELMHQLEKAETQLAALRQERDEARRQADCPMIQCPYEKRAEQAEAHLAALRQEREDREREVASSEFCANTIISELEAQLAVLTAACRYWEAKKYALDAVRPSFTRDQLRELNAAEGRLLAAIGALPDPPVDPVPVSEGRTKKEDDAR